MKKLLALFLVITLLATNLFTGTVYADSEYDLQDVNQTAQYLAGWDVDVEVGTLDYNCDGRVNLKDLVLLAQFVAGWNVVIGNGNNSIIPDDAYTQSVSATVTPVDGRVPAGGVALSNGNISAFVPEGVLLNANTTTITLKIAYLNNSAGGVVAGENEELVPVDVHIEGVSKNNTVPIIINMGKVLPEGLNLGNYKFFHVEDGVAKVMTLVDSADALTAHNTFTYDANTGEVSVAMATFSPVIVVYDTINPWQGNEDASWYDVDKTELTITNADQLYSFAKIVGGMAEGIDQDSFNGKTVKLLSDINLNQETVVEGGIERIFYPVGYYNSEGADRYDDKTGVAITSGFYTFEGTFDGNGHTISNVYQNTWEMKGDHDWYAPEDQHYRDGMGIFGKVYRGTVKNLTVDNFESDGEITTTGVIAAYADGATFENIAITNCNPRVYNIGNGGIVGCVGWYAQEADLKTTFKNITVDNSNKISALWGSYDVACGGIVGQYYPTSGQTSAGTPKNAGISFKNCHSAAQMDVYNDVCGNYQYYAYRYAGILMGSVRENVTVDGHVYPDMTGITAENCTVHFGTWNDYYYCELVANSLASYTHDHQFSRLEQVANVDVENKTITPLNGEPYVVPDSGRYNYVVVNGEHATENATCYHFVDGKVHNHNDYNDDSVDDYETVNGVSILVENNQHIYLEFNNLVTGYGWGVTSKAVDDMEGVTILDHEGASLDKFDVADNPINVYYDGMTVSVKDLFKDNGNYSNLIQSENVKIFVSPADENGTVSATYTPSNNGMWEDSLVTFHGTGAANITITDYYFCNPVTLTIANETTNEELNDVNSWTAITSSGGNYPVGSAWLSPAADTEAKDGATVNTIKFTGANAYTYATKLTVEKNKNYTLSFDYYSENLYNWDANRQVVYNTVGVAPLKEGSLIYRSSTTATPAALSTVCAGGLFKGAYYSGITYDDLLTNTVVTKTDDNWYSITFEFNSAENEEVEFFILTTLLGDGTSTEIANVKLERKYTTNEELNDVNNWSAITSGGGIYGVGVEWLSPVADTEAKDGATVNTIKFTGANAYTYATKLTVEKNKNYTLSFDYYSENLYNWDANRQVVYNTVGVAPLKEGSLIYRSSTTATPAALSTVCAGGLFKGAYYSGITYDDLLTNTVVTKTDDNWYSITFEFNSAENEEVEFFILTTLLGDGTSTEIANVKLEKIN